MINVMITEFSPLAAEWKKSIGTTSSVDVMYIHPAYQKIIEMGIDVVPLLLRELEKDFKDPHHWFGALKAITGEDPVRFWDKGKITKMTEAWLAWGRQKRLIA